MGVLHWAAWYPHSLFDLQMRTATGLIRHYLDNTQGLVLCVDSADRERMEEVKEYMAGVLGHEVCDGVPLLVMANKQDLGGAMSPKEVEGALQMDQLRGRPWGEQCHVTVM